MCAQQEGKRRGWHTWLFSSPEKCGDVAGTASVRRGGGGLARSSDGFAIAGTGVAGVASRPAAARPTAAVALRGRPRSSDGFAVVGTGVAGARVSFCSGPSDGGSGLARSYGGFAVVGAGGAGVARAGAAAVETLGDAAESGVFLVSAERGTAGVALAKRYWVGPSESGIWRKFPLLTGSNVRGEAIKTNLTVTSGSF